MNELNKSPNKVLDGAYKQMLDTGLYLIESSGTGTEQIDYAINHLMKVLVKRSTKDV